MSKDAKGTLGPLRTWALAAGGMVGGGIYIALGVVIEAAAQWAWLSFAIAGVLAVITSWSYARLTVRFHSAGGAFDFLENIDRDGWAGSLSWLLVMGYTLTISVYAFAFGNYLSHFFEGGALVIRLLAILIMGVMIALNLAGAGKLTAVEVVIVSGNLVVLLVLGAVGVAQWAPTQLSSGIDAQPLSAALVGAAAINSTLFSTAKLSGRVADDGELPSWFAHRNRHGIPDRAVIVVGVVAAVLASLGSLSSLVEAASLVFLTTFAVVNLIAAAKLDQYAWLPWAGTALSIVIGITLISRLVVTQPWTLAALAALAILVIALRPWLLRRANNDHSD